MKENDVLYKKDILKCKYTKDTEKVDLKHVKEAIKDYLKILGDTKYLLLNSREMNFVQVFELQSNLSFNLDKVASFIVDYLKEGCFMDGNNDIPLDDIKDIYQKDGVLNIYYATEKDLVPFILTPANWVVEKIK